MEAYAKNADCAAVKAGLNNSNPGAYRNHLKPVPALKHSCMVPCAGWLTIGCSAFGIKYPSDVRVVVSKRFVFAGAHLLLPWNA